MDLGSGIRKKPIPDPGVKKAPDPGSGSATLYKTVIILLYYGRIRCRIRIRNYGFGSESRRPQNKSATLLSGQPLQPFFKFSMTWTDLLATTKTSWGFSTAAMARAARSI
jgi:hypothetical protein